MSTYQFVSLFSPCQINQEDDLNCPNEKLRWVQEGFDWAWADNVNWFAYELTYNPGIVDGVMCDISDVIHSYGIESFIGKDEVEDLEEYQHPFIEGRAYSFNEIHSDENVKKIKQSLVDSF